MFHFFVCRSSLITNISQLLQNPSLIRFISTNAISNSNTTLDYLINSCGLSPESALIKKILLKPTTAKPDSVLSLLKSYGFTDTHISKIITTLPSLLFRNPDQVLQPKLKFFSDLGISGPHLGKFVMSDVSVLTRSLEKQVIPSVNFLRSLVHTDENIGFVLRKGSRVLYEAEMLMAPNIAILRHHGVPESNISKSIMTRPNLLCHKSDRFNEIVLELEKMGFSPLSTTFINGLFVLLGLKKTTWEAKVAFFRSFGWSEDECIFMFRKQPSVMAYSVEKLKSAIDFLMKSLNWTRSDFSKNAAVIGFSLEKRIIPRSYVIQTLLSKGLISKDGMGQAFRVSEDMFLKIYVIKHRDKIPELFEAYQRMMGTQGVHIGSTDGSKTEKL